MHVIALDAPPGEPITEFDSRRARARELGAGRGETHVYVVHIDAGGAIGPHPAGFGQLFVVLRGAGWVAGPDGTRRPIRAGEAAVIGRGELHAKGSDTGLTALMIQVAELTPGA